MRSTLVAMIRLQDALLATGASVRLSRAVTTDTIGLVVREPAHRWANRHDHFFVGDELWSRNGWRTHLVDGLECPFCVGFWIGLGVVVLRVAVDDRPKAVKAWRTVAAALTMNYAVGHVSSRMD